MSTFSSKSSPQRTQRKTRQGKSSHRFSQITRIGSKKVHAKAQRHKDAKQVKSEERARTKTEHEEKAKNIHRRDAKNAEEAHRKRATDFTDYAEQSETEPPNRQRQNDIQAEQ